MTKSIKVINLQATIKYKLNLSASQSLTFYCNNIILQAGNKGDLIVNLKETSMEELYQNYADADGFLYIQYIELTSFG
jgi:hypothetical protein